MRSGAQIVFILAWFLVVLYNQWLGLKGASKRETVCRIFLYSTDCLLYSDYILISFFLIRLGKGKGLYSCVFLNVRL